MTLLEQDDWSLTLQRRARDESGRERNLGTLPFVTTTSTAGEIRILAPLVPGETIWLGFDAPRDARLEGKTSAGDAIRIEQIGGYHAGRGLFAASSVDMPTGACAIDGALVFSRRGQESGLSLLFDIVTPSSPQRRLVVAFMAVDRFAQMTGVAPPSRTIEDSYGGWRLP